MATTKIGNRLNTYQATTAPITGCRWHQHVIADCGMCRNLIDQHRTIETERSRLDDVMADLFEQYDAGLDR